MKKCIYLMLMAWIIYSCNDKSVNPLHNGQNDSTNLGNLTISMSMRVAQIVQNNLMVDSVTVQLQGPENLYGKLVISADSSTATGTFTSLPAGDYSIEIAVFSGADTIAAGSGTATILPGKLTTANITLSFLPGSLTINVNWLPTDGLVAYYPFNGNAKDESGNGHDGTVFEASLTSDRFGNANKAYSFNGSSSYIVVPNSDSLLPQNGSFTIAGWLYVTTLDSGIETWLLDIDDGNSDYSGYGFYLIHSDTTLDTYWHYDDAWTHHTDTYGKFTLNHWNFVAAIFDRSNNTALLYLNGILTDTKSIDTNSITAWSDLYFGKRRYISAGSALVGKMDDIRMYNRALSAGEVSSLFYE